MIHPLAGVLSAYGMGLADMVELRQRTLAGADLETVLAELAAEASSALRARGIAVPEIRRRAALRYHRSDTALEVEVGEGMEAAFEQAHRARFGFTAEAEVVVETAIVEAVGRGAQSCSFPERGGGPRSEAAGWRGSTAGSLLPLHQPSAGPPPRPGEDPNASPFPTASTMAVSTTIGASETKPKRVRWAASKSAFMAAETGTSRAVSLPS